MHLRMSACGVLAILAAVLTLACKPKPGPVQEAQRSAPRAAGSQFPFTYRLPSTVDGLALIRSRTGRDLIPSSTHTSGVAVYGTLDGELINGRVFLLCLKAPSIGSAQSCELTHHDSGIWLKLEPCNFVPAIAAGAVSAMKLALVADGNADHIVAETLRMGAEANYARLFSLIPEAVRRRGRSSIRVPFEDPSRHGILVKSQPTGEVLLTDCLAAKCNLHGRSVTASDLLGPAWDEAVASQYQRQRKISACEEFLFYVASLTLKQVLRVQEDHVFFGTSEPDSISCGPPAANLLFLKFVQKKLPAVFDKIQVVQARGRVLLALQGLETTNRILILGDFSALRSGWVRSLHEVKAGYSFSEMHVLTAREFLSGGFRLEHFVM